VELIADTTLLIGIWREQSWAVSFARDNNRTLGLPWVVLGEFWQGSIRAGHDPEVVKRFLSVGVALLDAGPVVPFYANLCSRLQEMSFYKGIGQNDLWIAAVCLAFDRPLVTRNRRHFDKIGGLMLEVLEP